MNYEEMMSERKARFVERDKLAGELAKQRQQMITDRLAREGPPGRQFNPLNLVEPPWDEMGGSPEEDWTPTSLTATRRLRCAWGDRYALGAWFTTPPYDMYPYSNPDLAYVTRVGITPEGEACSYDGNGLAEYDTAMVTLGYETLVGVRPDQDPPPSGATLIEEEIQPSLELISIDGLPLAWGSATGEPVPDEALPVYRKMSVAYTITLYGVAALNPDTINLGGACHSLIYTSRTIGWTFPAQTLLYSPPTMTRSVDSLGVTAGWTLRIPWLYQPQTWNKFLNKSKLKASEPDPWEEIFYAGGEQLIVAPPKDLSWFLP